MTDFPHNAALIPPGAAPAPGAGATATPPAAPTPPVQGPSFGEVLRRETERLRFSSHALQRVERRGIDLADGTLERLEAGVARAAGKGARDSVVFVDGTAFVVSVRNRTVITAVDPEHMRRHVFTNIDSAVIA